MHNRRNLARALRSRRDKRRRRMTVRGRRTLGVWMRRVCLRDPPLCNQWGLIVGLPNLASPVKFRWRRPAGTRIRGGKTDMGLVKWRRCQTCMSSASVTRRHTKKARRETLAVLSSKPGSHRAWIANFGKPRIVASRKRGSHAPLCRLSFFRKPCSKNAWLLSGQTSQAFCDNPLKNRFSRVVIADSPRLPFHECQAISHALPDKGRA